MIVLFEDRKPGRQADAGGAATFEKRPLFSRASQRKARAIADVADGLLTAEEACERYAVDADELAMWQRALKSLGIKARRGK